MMMIERRPLSAALLAASFLVAGAFSAARGQALPSIPQPPPASPGSVSSHALGEPNRLPVHFADGADLPNGWRTTPAGKTIATTGDLITNFTVSPDGRVVAAVHSGFRPHGLDVFDIRTHKLVQRLLLHSAFLGLAWSPDGHTLYVAGGNAAGYDHKADPVTVIHALAYADGRFDEEPERSLRETIDPKMVWFSGLAYLPGTDFLYAANRGMGSGPSNVVVFNVKTRQIVTRIPVEVSPYQLLLSPDRKRLFVSNWSSESISVIDTATNTVMRSLHVGMNPNDMKLSADGRLFVACSNDNTVYMIDTHTLKVTERIVVSETPLAPVGSTPNALAIDNARKLLYVANADNNDIAVVRIKKPGHSVVAGFIPTGWYPSALALVDGGRTLFIGNTKGDHGGQPTPPGPYTLVTYVHGPQGDVTVRSLQTGSVDVLSVAALKKKLPHWTRQVMENTPYKDSMLSEARPPLGSSIIPQRVGEPSPIKHVIYIIKENRTYDQVLGDLGRGNGDPSLAIFGEKVTPNIHALARTFVTFDNLYCDGEVSADGHSWSDAAYATDFNEKQWPETYGGESLSGAIVRAFVPGGGYLWDEARRKGLTYRSYGEGGRRVSTNNGPIEVAAPGAEGLVGHLAKDWSGGLLTRDTDRVKIFLRDLRGWDADYDSSDPEKRLPNLIVMSMPEDHTRATYIGAYSPQASVASNDLAVGQLVEAVTHSRYWSTTAIFIIEDDAQDGPDHVDGRRTEGLVVSPYAKRGIVDSTLYSTSSMLRSMELLLGLPPMSQYDAAAMPMYAAFGTSPDLTPYTALPAQVDLEERNTKDTPGARESAKMDLTEPDRAPMHALNEIIWKSIKGANSEMPAPVHRFRPLIDVSDDGDDDDNGEPPAKARPRNRTIR